MRTTPPASTGETVRARTWDEYIGQNKMKGRLLIHVEAARQQGRMLDHMLLVGPTGAGKTTLAKLIAASVGDDFGSFMMPIDIKRLVRFIEKWQGGVLLLDEIHRAPTSFQESLLSIEDGYLETPTGERVSTRHVTFILATTEPQDVLKTLWDRMLVKPRWEDYADDEMAAIVAGMASRANVPMPVEIAHGLARATGGTPRVAGSLVVAYRDLCTTGHYITAEDVLDHAGIDCDGLNEQQIEYLQTLRELGRRSGLANICSLMQLSPKVVQGLERLLIKRGFVRLESTGRELTDRGATKLPNTTKTASDVVGRRAS
jgi:holliday junction DNA helicase RuvB